MLREFVNIQGFKKYFYVFTIQIATQGMGLAIFSIISTSLGSSGIGYYSFFSNNLLLLGALGTLGFETTILRFRKEYFSKKLNSLHLLQKIIPIIIIWSLVISLMGIFIVSLVQPKIDNIPSNFFYYSLFLTIPLSIYFLFVNFIRSDKVVVSEIFRQLLRPTCFFLMFYFISRTQFFVLSNNVIFWILIISYLIGITLVTAFILHKYKLKKNKIEIYTYKQLIKISSPVLIFSFFAKFTPLVSIYLIPLFLDLDFLGVFILAKKIALIASMPMVVVNRVATERLSHFFWNKQFVNLKSLLKKSSYLSIISTLILGTGILIFYDFLDAFFDKKSLDESFWPFIIILLSVLIRSTMGPKKEFSNQCGLQKNSAAFQAIILVVSVISNLVLITQFGILGAAISIVTISVLEHLYYNHIVKNHIANSI